MGISIVICCYNSALRLPETIKHIANQKVSETLPWEVVIVDNNSSDHTQIVARTEWDKYNCPASFKIVPEQIPGLSSARKKGVYETKYDYIIFCDDDNWLCESYVENAHKYITSKPNLAAIGGHGEPVFEIPEPEWFKKVSNSYALGSQKAPGTLYGAGLIVNKKVLLNLYEIGFKSLLSGRKGVSLSSGEDSEYTYLFQIIGYEVDFKPDLFFKHYISQDRLTLKYISKLFKSFGEAAPILGCYSFIYAQSKLSPPIQIFTMLFERIVQSPLIFLFGKSRPRLAHLIMNISSIKFLWKERSQYINWHNSILELQKNYNTAYNSSFKKNENQSKKVS